MTIYLAKWLHKHGEDVAAFHEEDAAYKQCVLWMRETLADWTDNRTTPMMPCSTLGQRSQVKMNS